MTGVQVECRQFVLIVADTPTVKQVGMLAALPTKPLVHSRPRQGTGRVLFETDDPDLAEAVLSAIRDVEAIGLRVVRLVTDDWVTLGAVGDRIGRSREAVRLWSLGTCGPGGFPPPLNPGRNTLFYSWFEVVAWLRQHIAPDVAKPEAALVAVNLVLRLRAMTDVNAIDLLKRLPSPEQQSRPPEEARPPCSATGSEVMPDPDICAALGVPSEWEAHPLTLRPTAKLASELLDLLERGAREANGCEG